MDTPQGAHGQPDVVLLSDEDAATQLLVGAVEGLWDVVSQLTRLRRTQRTNYRVTIFGSARARPGVYPYDEVKRLAAELTTLGCDIITGGGPGLMLAANEGAMSVTGVAPARSVGLRVELPFEQETNAFVGELYRHKTFFSRLHQFMIVSDAFVVVPGGIGSLLELSMVWQLLQVSQLRRTPLILVGSMWAELVDWSRKYMLRPDVPLASPADMEIPSCVGTVEETVAIIRQDREAWLVQQAAATSTRGD
jgi:uncharacterized protein (TIGR00730 family)